jgi:hypothetical protein
MSMNTRCTTDGVECLYGGVCNHITGKCVHITEPSDAPMMIKDCTADGMTCDSGSKCDSDTGMCVFNGDKVPPMIMKDCRSDGVKCGYGGTCDQDSGICVVNGREVPVMTKEGDCRDDGVTCLNSTCNPSNGKCINMKMKEDCRVSGCGFGGQCDSGTGECVGKGVPDLNIVGNQHNFNYAFYQALKNARKKDRMLLSGGMAFYLFIHIIFLIWGVMLAFKSQPKQSRVLHITLAIIFGPAYVLAYYLNSF